MDIGLPLTAAQDSFLGCLIAGMILVSWFGARASFVTRFVSVPPANSILTYLK